MKGWLFLNKTAVDNTIDIPTANAIGIVSGSGGLGFVDGGLFCGELVGSGVDAAMVRGASVGLGAICELEVGVGVVTGDCDWGVGVGLEVVIGVGVGVGVSGGGVEVGVGTGVGMGVEIGVGTGVGMGVGTAVGVGDGVGGRVGVGGGVGLVSSVCHVPVIGRDAKVA